MSYSPIPISSHYVVDGARLRSSATLAAASLISYGLQYTPVSRKDPDMRITAEGTAVVLAAIALVQLAKSRKPRSTLDDRIYLKNVAENH